MKNQWIIGIPLICLLLMPSISLASMASAHFQIKTSVISGAGGRTGSPGYSTDSVMGQPTPLMLQNVPPVSPGFSLFPGYLYTLKTSCFGDLNGDGDVDGSDLHIFRIGFPGSFDTDDLIKFANEFGKTDCQ